jgi:hypothetical protein
LRRKRNILDYTGEDMDDASMESCIVESEQLLADVETWLKAARPEMYGKGT